MLEEYGPKIIYKSRCIINQLYKKSSSREIKVNDPNKAGVDTAIVHTNTAKTKSEMVSHIAMTKRYCNDICKNKSRNC